MVAIDLLVRGTVIHTPSFSSLAVLENAVLGVHDGMDIEYDPTTLVRAHGAQ